MRGFDGNRKQKTRLDETVAGLSQMHFITLMKSSPEISKVAEAGKEHQHQGPLHLLGDVTRGLLSFPPNTELKDSLLLL